MYSTYYTKERGTLSAVLASVSRFQPSSRFIHFPGHGPEVEPALCPAGK